MVLGVRTSSKAVELHAKVSEGVFIVDTSICCEKHHNLFRRGWRRENLCFVRGVGDVKSIATFEIRLAQDLQHELLLS